MFLSRIVSIAAPRSIMELGSHNFSDEDDDFGILRPSATERDPELEYLNVETYGHYDIRFSRVTWGARKL
jgi:hypothetical protein